MQFGSFDYHDAVPGDQSHEGRATESGHGGGCGDSKAASKVHVGGVNAVLDVLWPYPANSSIICRVKSGHYFLPDSYVKLNINSTELFETQFN